jgi:hypothetical protein
LFSTLAKEKKWFSRKAAKNAKAKKSFFIFFLYIFLAISAALREKYKGNRLHF